MKRRRFIENALILTVFMIIMRTVSTAFSIYLSRKIGSEGMGLYQLISSVYMLSVTFSLSGMGLTVTKLVAEENAKRNFFGVKQILRRSLIISLFLGIISGALLFCFSNPIGVYILKEKRTVLPLRLLSASLPFLSAGAVLRGYFLGLQDALKSISGDILEQLSGVLFTVILLSFFSPRGIEAACVCLVLGSDISEAVSALYSYIIYKKSKRKSGGSSLSHIGKRIGSIAFPIAVSSYFRSALNSLENILLPLGLQKYGFSKCEALSQYGMVKGMVMPLIYFPSAVLSAVSGMLVPEVSAAYAVKNQVRIEYIIKKCLKWAMYFSFFIMSVFLFFHKEISAALFKSEGISKLLLSFAPLVPLMYIDQIVDSILKGLNEQLISMEFNMADSALRVILIFFLVPIIGVKGYIFMFYAGTIFNACLSINRLITVGRVKFRPFEWIFLPMIFAFLSSAAAKALPFSFVAEIIGAFLSYCGLISVYLLFSRRKKPALKKAKTV